jgi:hypothetical protein
MPPTTSAIIDPLATNSKTTSSTKRTVVPAPITRSSTRSAAMVH